MGRKSKILDENTRGTIVKYIKNGNYIKTACMAAGISERAYYDWVARGENPKGEDDEIYMQFLQELKRAEAKAQAETIARIDKAGKKPQYWMANAWRAERKNPELWGRRDVLEIGPSKVLLALQEQAQKSLAEPQEASTQQIAVIPITVIPTKDSENP